MLKYFDTPFAENPCVSFPLTELGLTLCIQVNSKAAAILRQLNNMGSWKEQIPARGNFKFAQQGFYCLITHDGTGCFCAVPPVK
jgi:hypothetical protein